MSMSLDEEQILQEISCKNQQPKWLCVTKVPFCYSEELFRILVQFYGDVRKYLLVKSRKTGNSKGYGFVQYSREESYHTAISEMNQTQLNGLNIVCHLADFIPLDIGYPLSLHSRCLYVECLPKYIDIMIEFRKIFSFPVRPVFCQVALKDSCPQDWGVVEYGDPDDAEIMQTKMDGYDLFGSNIRVTYCFPGFLAHSIIYRNSREYFVDDPKEEKKMASLPASTAIVASESGDFSSHARNTLSLSENQSTAPATSTDWENRPTTSRLLTDTHREIYSPYKVPAKSLLPPSPPPAIPPFSPSPPPAIPPSPPSPPQAIPSFPLPSTSVESLLPPSPPRAISSFPPPSTPANSPLSPRPPSEEPIPFPPPTKPALLPNALSAELSLQIPLLAAPYLTPSEEPIPFPPPTKPALLPNALSAELSLQIPLLAAPYLTPSEEPIPFPPPTKPALLPTALSAELSLQIPLLAAPYLTLLYPPASTLTPLMTPPLSSYQINRCTSLWSESHQTFLTPPTSPNPVTEHVHGYFLTEPSIGTNKTFLILPNDLQSYVQREPPQEATVQNLLGAPLLYAPHY